MFGRNRRSQDDEAVEVDPYSVEAEVTTGPFDVADVPDDDDVKRIDMGTVRIPALPGVQIGVASGEDGKPKPELMLQTKTSMLRLVACAAPRLEGIWDEVREQIAETIKKQGGSATEIPDGEYGIELLAKQPSGQSMSTVRLVGIDGPRWFLRGTFAGARATDPEKDTVLDETLRNVVVDRGTEAMPVKESLPLRLTPEMLKQQQKAAVAGDNGQAAPKRKPSPKK